MSRAREDSAKLGDLIESADPERAGTEKSHLPLLSITKADGLVSQGEKFRKRIASADVKGYRVVKEGQLVVGLHMDEANLAIQRLHPEALVSPAYKLWNVRRGAQVESGYLERFLLSPRALAYYTSQLRGTAHRRGSLPKKVFMAMEVPLPSPAEQRRIVDILDRADDLQAKRQAAIDKLDSLTQAIFHDMFGDPFANTRDWEIGILAEVAEINPGMTETLAEDERVSFVPMSALSAELAGVEDVEGRQYGEVSNGYTPFHDGDLLVAKITPCFENRKIGRATIPTAVGFGSTEFIVVRPGAGSVNSEYLLAILRSDRFVSEGSRLMTGAVGHRRVPLRFLESLNIPLPPIEAQNRFGDEVMKLEAINSNSRVALREIKQLADSLQQQAFSGGL